MKPGVGSTGFQLSMVAHTRNHSAKEVEARGSELLKVIVNYTVFIVTFCRYLLKACSFLKIGRESDGRGGSDGEELGRVEGGETVIRVYCGRK